MSKQFLVTQNQSVDGVLLEGNPVHYAVCSTAAATVAKTVISSEFKLITGAWLAIKFTTTNMAANPTLNVNRTGAKAICYRNTAVSAGVLAADHIYLMVYDGSYWQIVGDLDTNTTYGVASVSAAGLMSVDDKSKLNNTMSVTSIVQGNIGGLTVDKGKYFVPNLSRASKALVEYWSESSTVSENFSHYGSRYFTRISPIMTAIAASVIFQGASQVVGCGMDETGRPYFNMAVKDEDYYRVTWFL